MSRRAVRWATLLTLCAATMIVASATASAHPLGNFTVNHYNGLTLHPDRVQTLVGVLLVRLRDKLERLDQVDRLRHRIGRMSALIPVLTSVLVIVVGLGLAARAASGIG